MRPLLYLASSVVTNLLQADSDIAGSLYRGEQKTLFSASPDTKKMRRLHNKLFFEVLYLLQSYTAASFASISTFDFTIPYFSAGF